MFGVEQKPVKTGARDQFGRIGAGERTPKSDLLTSFDESAFEGVAGKLHRVFPSVIRINTARRAHAVKRSLRLAALREYLAWTFALCARKFEKIRLVRPTYTLRPFICYTR